MTHTLLLVAHGITAVSGAIALGALHYYFRSGTRKKTERTKDASKASETADVAGRGSVLFRDQSGEAARALRNALDAVAGERREQKNEIQARPFEFCVFDD
ncbi:MAG: hypothetical protein IKX88_13740 [Thermoguttaceae bacterium]|nr:hypothetical protein [Thermoguttaceae bacterium]